jgi:hypothetical protein
MVDQAQQIDGRPAETPPRAVARSTGELLNDLVTLAELQGKLCLVDARDGVNKLLTPAIIFAAGVMIGLGCVPVALAALALALVELVKLTYAQAFGIALLAGIVLAGGLCWGAIGYLRCCFHIFDRTQIEWHQNLKWGKDALARFSKSGAHSACR